MKSLLKRLSCLFLRLEGLISQCFTSDASQLGLASDKTIDLYKWLGNLSDACYIGLTEKEKSRLDRDDSDCSSTRVMSVNTSRSPAVVILLSFPANNIYTYHFVYSRYSTTIFLKFSVQKLFTFALVVIQITCISARVSGD